MGDYENVYAHGLFLTFLVNISVDDFQIINQHCNTEAE